VQSVFELNTPDGAFYVFPKVSSYFGKQTKNYHITDANALCMYLLNEAHVAIVPGEAFGVSGYARISYAASEEKLKTAISRIKSALEKLT
jgi:aspartate aminotransferase